MFSIQKQFGEAAKCDYLLSITIAIVYVSKWKFTQGKYNKGIRDIYTRIYSELANCLKDRSFEVEPGEATYVMASVHIIEVMLFIGCLASLACGHGPPPDRDSEDIAMGRKVQKVPPRRPESMSAKWCSMAKVCNHDRVPICGLSHAGDVMGFRDLCDMFDYNCIRRRNYKQTSCPADRNFLTASRKPTNSFYDE